MKQEPIIYDTTLREGMQTPGGIGGTIEERVYAANLISRFSDWVEVGMPANEVDYNIISAIRDSFIDNSRDCGIAVLCRNTQIDIDRAEQVFEGYNKTLAHLFIGTSKEHRDTRFGGKWATKDYIKNIKESVEYASEKPFTRIMFSPEDSYRTFAESPRDFFKFVDAAIEGYETGSVKVGRTEKLILNFPDTVGLSRISEFDSMLDKIRRKYKDKIEISLHGHNDSGSSLQQVVEAYGMQKANWLQTTFTGLGERNGIAPTEAVIADLDKRGELAAKKFGNEKELLELVPSTYAILASIGRTVPAESPVSGSRTNVSTAGIHTQIAQQNDNTYHINGKRYGAIPVMEFGPTSGAEQIVPIIADIGIVVEKKDQRTADFTNMLKEVCNREKRALSETDIKYEAIRFFGGQENPLHVMDYSIMTNKGMDTTVDIAGRYEGKIFKESFKASGPIEAIIGGLDKVVNHGRSIELVGFTPRVVPRVPKDYFSWPKGEYPRIAADIDVHSELQTVSKIKSANRPDISYEGFASSEDSFQSMIDSVIDAVVKMTAIQKWEDRDKER